jgi:hypothetical protein
LPASWSMSVITALGFAPARRKALVSAKLPDRATIGSGATRHPGTSTCAPCSSSRSMSSKKSRMA